MDANSDKSANWRIGQKLVLDGGRREVVVDDICGDRVRCRWTDHGTPRSSWIPASRLDSLVRSNDHRTFIVP